MTLFLATLCLGIAVTGLAMVAAGNANGRVRCSLGLVYCAFVVIVAAPLVAAYAQGLYLFHVPLIFVALMILPPAVYHFVAAKTAQVPHAPVPWRDICLPLAASVICLGFWWLPAETKAALFISGDLPPGVMPAALAMGAFLLVISWLGASPLYLIASVRRLRIYRAHIRQQYSNLGKRDLRWVDWVMTWLVVLWAAAAASLAADNLGGGLLFPIAALLALTACYLLFLTIFAANAPAMPVPAPPVEPAESKYARSALSADHAAKLAARIKAAMRKDALYLDPNLSLQKLSRHIGAPPNLVSQTLNEVIGASFFDYIAHWRITASKPLIVENQASVLTIALDVGFNTRSTFYKAFKRETGMTPKAFRAAQTRQRPTDQD